jgi:plastocyanin
MNYNSKGENAMRRKACLLVLLATGLCCQARAGDIGGKVSGMKGKSVVYVDAIAGKTFPAPKEHPVIDQKGLMFSPHIVVVQQGTTVDFQNSDNVAHNVFWTAVGADKKAGHNLGTWPKGEKRSYTFDKAGAVPLLCNVHPEMAGYLIVSPTPYFAETDESGNYTIKDVPDGSYTLTAWHEGAKNQSKPVSVSGATKADFTLTK